jgi:predicted nucleotidyltransferase
MSPDERFLESVLKALEKVHLEAIIVGATAAIMHNAPILTRDIDLLIRDTELNRRKLEALSRELGGTPPASVSELTSTLRIIGTEIPIDILLDRIAGGLTFESLKSRPARFDVGGHTALVATLEDVIRIEGSCWQAQGTRDAADFARHGACEKGPRRGAFVTRSTLPLRHRAPTERGQKNSDLLESYLLLRGERLRRGDQIRRARCLLFSSTQCRLNVL